ncbi:MAG: tRNA guanosine(15) transglycosylase TgtA [Halobacteriales archaeon]|nr:tRNA guanosine(15) transglycosylase TgtA [Halobacteriales archaeon]
MVKFEIDAKDAMGRVGRLEVGDKTVTTPALMPVVNPHFGAPNLSEAEIAITNAYIIYTGESYGRAVEEGVHALVSEGMEGGGDEDNDEFDGVVVTDSGSYQMSVYGDDEIDVSNREILEFQREIGTDVATPLDVPTPPDVSRERAEEDLETTLRRVREAVELYADEDAPALNAPVQGALYDDLRERSAREAYETGADIYPVGAVVPLMTDYRFGELVDVIVASKRGLGADAPVHLFGAGHPMVFGLAVALGCDLFDSAAYALYAEKDRYLTPEGTLHTEDLNELPCACPVCRDATADELTFDGLAQHNLNVSFAEMRRVREATRAGNLLELVEQRCHAHPHLLDGLERLGAHADEIERHDPVSKSSFFYLGNPYRPEVVRHNRRVERFDVGDEAVVTAGKAGGRDCFLLRPPFGPFPPELSQTYPLNAETPAEPDTAAVGTALEGVKNLVSANPDAAFTLEHPGWKHPLLDDLRDEGVNEEVFG